MLDHLKSQRGSTLAIALIIIVLFSILGLGLVTLNASASKQFTNKEQQVQARHFAEMGLMHYKSKVKKVLAEHNEELRGIKDSSLTEKQKIDAINLKNSQLCSKLTVVDNIKPINLNTDINYNISRINCNNDNNTSVTIDVTSDGKSPQEKVVKIDLKLSLILPGNLKEGTEGIGDGVSIKSKKPVQNPNTPAPLVTYKNLTTGKNKNFIDQNIHITENYTANNIKTFSGTQLFIDGDMISNNFTQGLTNSILYTGGNLTSHNGTGDISNSTIYVTGTFKIKQINGAISSSKIFVENDLIITSNGNGSGSVASNSLICVVGKIDTAINKYKHNGSNIFSLATMLEKGESIIIFKEKCSGELTSGNIPDDISTRLDEANYSYH